MKKVIIILAIVGLLLGFFIFKAKSASDKPLKTATVKRGSIVKSISASGKVDSEEVVDLKFQSSGLLTWVGVKEGDNVSAWQAIAQLDTKELQKTLQKDLRDYASQRNDFEEKRTVTYPYGRPENALTDSVKRILEKNQWDLEKSVLDVELQQLAIKYSTLITPIAGLVTQVDASIAGVNITPATAVFQVANPEKMIFRANIDEADIAGIKTGLKVKITLDAYSDEVFEGLVTKVGFASVSTSGGGTAFPVEISLPQNDNLKFKVGLSGDAEIIIESKKNILTIPQSSISENNGKSTVSVLNAGKIEKVAIKTGLTNDVDTEVTSGLQAGQKVVIK